VVARKRKHTYI